MKSVRDPLRWPMLAAGVLTCTMIVAAFDPQAALQSTFGQALDGPVADVVVRSWGVLIALVGALLIYGAFDVRVRAAALAVAAVSKATYVALVLSFGASLLPGPALVSVTVDAAMVLLLSAYLVAIARRTPRWHDSPIAR